MFRGLLLIVPPQIGLLEGFVSGLVALANYVSVREPSICVRLLDLGPVPTDMVRGEIQAAFSHLEGEVLVGITTTTATYQAALKVAQIVKGEAPNSKIVLGGHHSNSQSQAQVILRHHRAIVDFVIRGEGEEALLDLLRFHPQHERVRNLCYTKNGEYHENPSAPRLLPPDLDRLPPTFRGAGIRSAPGKFDHVTYVSARGCPLSCAFCAVANDKINAKSIPAIVADIRTLVSELGFRRIAIEDNFFAHSPSRTIELCRALAQLRSEEGIEFSWDCQTRVESMRNPEILVAMEAAGCEAVYLGVESLVARQLHYLRKTNHPAKYIQLLYNDVGPRIIRSSVACYINIQIGLPNEDRSDEEETLRRLASLGTIAGDFGKMITIFPMLHVVYPGTQHFEEALLERRFGPLEEDVFEEFTRWEAEQEPVLRWLGDHFAHGTGGIPEGILVRDKLRNGIFEVDASSVLRVANYLNAIDNIDHVDVFKYGSYLTQGRLVRPRYKPKPHLCKEELS